MSRVCYAEKIGGCGGVLSREHIISKNVLETLIINKNNKKINAKGFIFCKEEKIETTVDSFTMKCLCEKHNNCLSDFDNEAKKLFSFNNILFENIKSFKEINLLLLEKWCLKTMLNMHLSENKDYKVDNYYLNFLFKNKEINNENGLYMAVDNTHLKKLTHIKFNLEFHTILNENNLPVGLFFSNVGIYFFFSMTGKDLIEKYSKVLSINNLYMTYRLKNLKINENQQIRFVYKNLIVKKTA